MSDEKKAEPKTIGAKLAETAEGVRREAERKAREEAKKEFDAWLPGSAKAIQAFCDKHLFHAAQTGEREVVLYLIHVMRELGLKNLHTFEMVAELLATQEIKMRHHYVNDGDDPRVCVS